MEPTANEPRQFLVGEEVRYRPRYPANRPWTFSTVTSVQLNIHGHRSHNGCIGQVSYHFADDKTTDHDRCVAEWEVASAAPDPSAWDGQDVLQQRSDLQMAAHDFRLRSPSGEGLRQFPVSLTGEPGYNEELDSRETHFSDQLYVVIHPLVGEDVPPGTGVKVTIADLIEWALRR